MDSVKKNYYTKKKFLPWDEVTNFFNLFLRDVFKFRIGGAL